MDPPYIHEYVRIVRTYWWSRSRHEFTGRLAQRDASRIDSVLDVGCLNGPVLEQFDQARLRVGIDLSPHSLQQIPPALRRAARFARASGERVPCGDATFDVVTSVDVLEHVPDDRAAVHEMMRVLAPGGVVIVIVPAHAWLRTSRDAYLGHLRRYSRRRLVALLTNAGLRVEWSTYLAASMVLPLLGLRVAEWLGARQFVSARRASQSGGGWLNTVLYQAHSLEARLGLRIPLPIGSAVAAVARKPGATHAGDMAAGTQ